MEIFLKIALAFYFLGIILIFTKKRWIVFPILGLVFHIIGILVYSLKLEILPFTNLSPSLIFFSALLVSFWLLFNTQGGEYVLSIAIITLSYVILFPFKPIPLMPALRSIWLPIHVITCFISYAFFSLSAILGLVFLRKQEELGKSIFSFILSGFLFLTIGIITGSIWAYYAWGRYWAWDPKEVWALITWLYYVLFFHLKLVGISKRKEAILSIIGFLIILFTFLGVSFLLPGLHSYL